jgi:hypothetical protein
MGLRSIEALGARYESEGQAFRNLYDKENLKDLKGNPQGKYLRKIL